MKRIRTLLVLAGLLVTSGGCDQPLATPLRQGSLTGVLDGQPWESNALTDVFGDTIHIGAQRTNGSSGHWFQLRVVESAPGVYTIVTPAQSPFNHSRYVEIVGGDVVSYDAPVTAGTLDVQEFDRATGALRGTLSLTIQGTRGTSRLEQGQLTAVSWRQPGQR